MVGEIELLMDDDDAQLLAVGDASEAALLAGKDDAEGKKAKFVPVLTKLSKFDADFLKEAGKNSDTAAKRFVGMDAEIALLNSGAVSERGLPLRAVSISSVGDVLPFKAQVLVSALTGQAIADALRSVAEFLGTVIGYVAAGIAGAIGVMVSFVVNRLAVIIAAFRSVVGFIGGVVDILGGLVTGNWAQVWVGFKKVVLNTINFLAQLLLGFVETIAGVIDTIAGVFGADLGGADAIRSLRQDIERGLLEGVDEVTAGVTVAPAGSTLTALDAATSTMPAVAAMTPAVPASFPMTPATPPASPPITVNLQVDGTTLATAVHRADRDTATRSFSPVPAY